MLVTQVKGYSSTPKWLDGLMSMKGKIEGTVIKTIAHAPEVDENYQIILDKDDLEFDDDEIAMIEIDL